MIQMWSGAISWGFRAWAPQEIPIKVQVFGENLAQIASPREDLEIARREISGSGANEGGRSTLSK